MIPRYVLSRARRPSTWAGSARSGVVTTICAIIIVAQVAVVAGWISEDRQSAIRAAAADDNVSLLNRLYGNVSLARDLGADSQSQHILDEAVRYNGVHTIVFLLAHGADANEALQEAATLERWPSAVAIMLHARGLRTTALRGCLYAAMAAHEDDDSLGSLLAATTAREVATWQVGFPAAAKHAHSHPASGSVGGAPNPNFPRTSHSSATSTACTRFRRKVSRACGVLGRGTKKRCASTSGDWPT